MANPKHPRVQNGKGPPFEIQGWPAVAPQWIAQGWLRHPREKALRAAARHIVRWTLAEAHYQEVWTEFVEPFHGVDAMLNDVPDPDRIDLLLGFACRSRAGDYGDGMQ
jgi:hypothetical protein